MQMGSKEWLKGYLRKTKGILVPGSAIRSQVPSEQILVLRRGSGWKKDTNIRAVWEDQNG